MNYNKSIKSKIVQIQVYDNIWKKVGDFIFKMSYGQIFENDSKVLSDIYEPLNNRHIVQLNGIIKLNEWTTLTKYK
jgi:hypothetical protein